MIRNRNNTQSFNDGTVRVYAVKNASEPGNLPVEELELKHELRYCERTVGIKRYYAALQANVQIDRVLRCNRREDVSTQDVAIVNGCNYVIGQVQYPQDVLPPCMDLSLKRVEKVYGIISDADS